MQSTISLQSSWEWDSFESNYRSVFQPPGLDCSPASGRGTPSLFTLATNKIVSDARLSLSASQSVPRSVLLHLAQAAVRSSRAPSLAALLPAWPLPTLSLSSLHTHSRLLDGQLGVEERRQRTEAAKEVAVTLMASFQKLVLSGRSLTLTTLDLTSYPLPVDHLISVLQGFSEAGSRGNRAEVTLVVDLYLTDQQSWRLNRLGQLRAAGVRVKVRHIYFSVLSHGSTYSWHTEYLEVLNKFRIAWSHIFDLSGVVGLELARLDLRSFFAESNTPAESNRGIRLFSFLAESFSQLTTLDLAYNAINLNGSPGTCAVLADLLSRLPHLGRLDLSGNRLTNSLPALLAQAPNLQYLNLTGTQLRTADLSYLSRCTALTHLDLSSCSLSNRLNALLSVLAALQKLEVLELVDSGLEQGHCDVLLPALRNLPRLQLLNLAGNSIAEAELPCRVIMDQIVEDYLEFEWP